MAGMISHIDCEISLRCDSGLYIRTRSLLIRKKKKTIIPCTGARVSSCLFTHQCRAIILMAKLPFHGNLPHKRKTINAMKTDNYFCWIFAREAAQWRSQQKTMPARPSCHTWKPMQTQNFMAWCGCGAATEHGKGEVTMSRRAAMAKLFGHNFCIHFHSCDKVESCSMGTASRSAVCFASGCLFLIADVPPSYRRTGISKII